MDLRVAIVGYGLAGRFFHAPLIAATDGLTVTSVVTSSAERADQVARDVPDTRVLTSPEHLWELADQHELVVLATPNDAHAPLANEAIDRGLPVVVDKPLAVSAAEAQGLIEHARQQDVLLTVFQNRRWDSDHLTLVRLIAEHGLGSVIRYESRFERWRPSLEAGSWREAIAPERGGGQLLDLGSHLVDQALVLFGPATHVYAEVDTLRGSAGDDDAFLALRHAGGVVSHLRASAMTAAPGPRLRVLGTQAAFIAQHLDTQEDRLRAGARPDTVADWGVEPESCWARLVKGEESVTVPSERGAWQHFYGLLVEALREGGPPPVDPADALATLRVLEAARRSAADRTIAELPG